MPTLFQFRSFLQYWLNAVTEHSLHSPFFFAFYNNTIKSRNRFDSKSYKSIEDLRKKLRKDHKTISIVDLGSGSKHGNIARRVSAIAKTSLTPKRFCALYNRIIAYYNLNKNIELGTSLGINTLYLSLNKNSHVTTFEGSPEIASVARANFDIRGAKNIELQLGNIDDTLPAYLKSSDKLDFIFIDANHRYEPTRKYFHLLCQKVHENSVMIIDDIHCSSEMEKAWEEVRHDERVYGSVDLYRCGILFFNPSLNKQHVVMQFW